MTIKLLARDFRRFQFAPLSLLLHGALQNRRPRGSCHEVSSVQTAMRNCTRDEGRSFEAGSQVQASNLKPLQAAVIKSDGSERCS